VLIAQSFLKADVMIQLPTHPAPLNWLVLCIPNLAHWMVRKCRQIPNAGSAGAYVKFVLHWPLVAGSWDFPIAAVVLNPCHCIVLQPPDD
jgi:hypothetical protein